MTGFIRPSGFILFRDKPTLRRTPAQQGFTLLEVLVALAVIAIAMGGVMRAVSLNVSNTGYLQEKTMAHWVALNKMNEFTAMDKFPRAGGRDKGEVYFAGHEWTWSASTVKEKVGIPVPGGEFEIGVVTVEVRFDEKDESPRASLITAIPLSK